MANSKKVKRGLIKSSYFLFFGVSLGAFELVTGFYLLIVKNLNSVDMMFLLAHAFLGFFLWVFPIAFLKQHFKYKKVFADFKFNMLGFLTAFSAILSLTSGSWVTFSGVTKHEFFWWIHVASSFVWALGLCLYVIELFYKILKIKNFRATEFIKYKFFSIAKIVLFSVSIAGGALILAGVLYSNMSWYKTVENYSLPFSTENIFYPSVVTAGSNTLAINQKALSNSQSCGTTGCHSEILKQWEQSYHKKSPNPISIAAMNDYIQEVESGKLFHGKIGSKINKLKKDSQKTGVESLRRCTGCHDSVSLLAGKTNPAKGFKVEEHPQGEGVSCLVCHTISETRRGSRDDKFSISEPRRYLFSESSHPVGRFLYETLIKIKPEQHRKAFKKEFYKESVYCMSCHRGAVQYGPWLKSVYAPANADTPNNVKQCQTCHMPQIKTENDVSALAKGSVSDHRFLAIGVAMAKYYGLNEQALATEKFLKTDKVYVKLLMPEVVDSNEVLTAFVRVANEGVGHLFPGAPDGLVEAWPELKIIDSLGKTKYIYGALSKEGYLDYKTTKVFRTIMYDRNGRELRSDRHQTWRATTKKVINIKPKEYVEFPIKINLKELGLTGQVRAELRLKFREPNQQFIDWVFGKGKFNVPVIDMAEDFLAIKVGGSLKEKKQAKNNFNEKLRKNFDPFLKSKTDFLIHRGLDSDDRAVKIILREIDLLIADQKYNEARELMAEFRMMHPMKKLVDVRLRAIEEKIQKAQSAIKDKNNSNAN